MARARSIEPVQAYRWGHYLLVLSLFVALLVLALAAWQLEGAIIYVPVAMIASVAALWMLSRMPRALYFVLFGFVAIASHQEGIQIEEVLYGILFLGFLVVWWISRVVYLRDRQLTGVADIALAIFLALVLFTLFASAAFNARPDAMVGEALTLSMILFYFPVKEAVRRDPKALRRIGLLIGWFALFVAVRNLFIFRRALGEAEYLWEVTQGRIALNEVILMMASLFGLTLLVYATRVRERLVLAGAFLISFAGLVITQSRAYWASFLLGALLLFLFVEWKKKGQIVGLVAIGLGGFLLLGWLLYPAFVQLMIVGVVDRFTSLATATTEDISLVNRFYETRQVWEYVKENPVLGYGMGTPYRYYNVIYKLTRDWTFIHNGYISLWYKFGIAGLGAMLVWWGISIVNGFRLFKKRSLPRAVRFAALAGAVCLSAETLVANTSNPFLIADATLMMAIMAGMINGLAQKWGAGHRSADLYAQSAA